MEQTKHEIQKLMKQCKLLKKQSYTTFIDIDIYLEFMHQTILQKDNFFPCNSKVTRNNIFHKNFFNSFEQLSQLQQTKYYYAMLKTMDQHIKGNCKSKQSEVSKIGGSQLKSKSYEVDIITKGFFNNTEKNHYLEIKKKNKILLIKSQNNPYDLQVNLQNYFVRQSKKNSKGTARRQFYVLKAGSEFTPHQIHFAMKNVYEFPLFFSDLWNQILEIHSKKLIEILEQISQGKARRGYAEIVFLKRQQSKIYTKSNILPTTTTAITVNPQTERGFNDGFTDPHLLEDYQYLDTNHPVERVNEELLEKVGLKDEQLQGHFLWGNQWQKTKKGNLKNVNFQYIAVQRSAVKKIIKKFISMSNGQSQMPIEMFSNQSNLLQLARSCKYFNYFFEIKNSPIFSSSCSATSRQTCQYDKQLFIVDGFKKAFCSIIGFLLIRNKMQKPIQPFLGQTYQGFIDGYPIFVEQISKNQSFILYQTEYFKLYGSLQLKTSTTGLNSIAAGSKGYLKLQLLKIKKSPTIIFTIPMIQLSGLIYGDRTVQINDTSVMYEEQSRVFCLLSWGKNKKAGKKYENLCDKNDFVKGQVIRLKEGKVFDMQKYLQKEKHYVNQFMKDLSKDKGIQKTLDEVYGNWTTQLFNGLAKQNEKLIFKVDEQRPKDLYHYKYPLTSDSRLRKDILLLNIDNITQAQQQRRKQEEIEEKQRKMRIVSQNKK